MLKKLFLLPLILGCLTFGHSAVVKGEPPSPSRCLKALTAEAVVDDLLGWDVQILLRKDQDNFKSPDDLSYSYSKQGDAIKYRELSSRLAARLSPGEARALEDYTAMSGSKHEQLNLILAKMNFKSNLEIESYKAQLEKIKVSRRHQTSILNLLSAFEKGVTLPKGLLLFRGIGPGASLSGKIIRSDRLTSTSMDPETARFFTQEGNEKTYLLVIKLTGPVKALMAKDAREMEFLLPPGLRYEVTGRKYDSKSKISVLQVNVSTAD